MSDGLHELGLRTELVEAAEARGYEAPTALQRAAIPVLRRGGNAVLHASYGSGLTAAYGLPLLDRIAGAAGGDSPRVLIVTPTAARAASAADELTALAARLDVRVRALAPGWREAESADVVIGALASVSGAIGRSALKLDALQTIVVESLSILLAEFGRDALDGIMTAVPRDAQRVITTTVENGDVERFVESYVRRPMHVPARLADPVAGADRPAVGIAHYLVVAEHAKDDALARLLVRSAEEDVLVTTRSTQRAHDVRLMLEGRGYAAAESGALRVQSAMEAPPRGARVIAYDVPMDVETLTHVHTGAGLILVTPGELAHLRRLAQNANVTLQAEKARAADRDVGAGFRSDVRRALAERDLEAQLLLLDPLFDEYSPAEVAAALSALLREQRALDAEPRNAAAPPESAAAGTKQSAPATFTRLFLSIGSRDNVRAGDLVGAITGEAGITGSQVGKIELRDTFSVVEVAADAAERVIRALNGTTMRGRSLRVDYDRRGSSARAAGGERGRPPRPEGSDRPRRPRPDAGDRVRRPRSEG